MLDETRLKRLRFRAWRRGFREADLILGPFADNRGQTLSDDQVLTLQRMVVEHPGESQVFLHLGDGGKVLRLPEKFCVDLANGLMGEIKSTFGADAVLA